MFDRLNLEMVPDVKAALERGDEEAAVRAWAAHLRNRLHSPWANHLRLPQSAAAEQKALQADRIVRGEIEEQAIGHVFERGDIDWFYNPTREDDDLAVNNEWQWQLNRMGFWVVLGSAYQMTGNEIYAQTWVKHLRSWAEQCARPDDHGNYAESCWRTIESGIRMAGSWPRAFRYFLHSPSFTDLDVVLYVKLCVEHAIHLRTHHRPAGNWLTMEMAGLYSIGAIFPELKEAAEWRAYAAEHSYRELDTQFTPDGAQVELSPGYHWVALGNILTVPRVAKAAGFERELPVDFLSRAEKAFEFTLLMRTPDGSTPRANDTPNTQDVASILRVGAELFPERADFLWAATNGVEGELPARTSVNFDYAGYYVMRSGWASDANMLCFDAGPTGLAHIHQDKLNMMVWAFGREVLLDTGGGPYEQSKWRRYGLSTFSHNTVIVDGLPQNRERGFASEPLTDVTWVTTDDYDYAVGVYDELYEDALLATHKRHVLFVKPDIFLVWDVLISKDDASHTYQARWHVTTPNTKVDGPAVVTMDEGQPNLAIVPLLEGVDVQVVSAQEEPELLGWWIRKRIQPSVIPATTVLHDRSGDGVQHFMTLLLPLQTGESNPVQGVRQVGKLEVAVDLKDGRLLRCVGTDARLCVTEVLADGSVGREVRAG
ncbi:MAG: hypothetical protein ACI8V2_002945 [Candidatus Latescibacterota bacterium]